MRVRAKVLRGVLAASIGCVAVLVPAARSDAAPCLITPALRDVTVNQGVGSYASLAPGKESLVRFYVTLPAQLPSCAGNGSALYITGGGVTVNGTANQLTVAPLSTPPAPGGIAPPFSGGPQPDSVSDLKFVLRGADLVGATTDSFTATFTVTINFQSKGAKNGELTPGSQTYTSVLGSTSPITRRVEARRDVPDTTTDDVTRTRVLVIPMGDARSPDTNFPATAVQATNAGMAAVSRILPGGDGIGELNSTGTGLRYTLAPAPAMIDLGPNGLNLMTTATSGKFCGTSGNWPLVRTKLAESLANFNAANPTSAADRVVGVVWNQVSLGGAQGCNEGLATLGAPEAFVRVFPDATAPSNTGALITHELLHTFAGVPEDRDDGGFHSPSTEADGGTNRAYNVTLRSFLLNDRNVARLSSGWDNTTTVLEPLDWALFQCNMTPILTGCPQPGSTGSAAAGPAIVLAGRTDGVTADLHSYLDSFVERTLPGGDATYQLVQKSSTGAELSRSNVPVKFVHVLEGEPGDQTTATIGVVDARVDAHPSAARFEFVKGAMVLFARDRGVAPDLQLVRTLWGLGSASNISQNAGDDTSGSVSGGVAAYQAGVNAVRVRSADPACTAQVAITGESPSISGNGQKLAVIDGDSIVVRTVALSGCTVTLGAATPVFNPLLPGLLGYPATDVALNGDGSEALAVVNSNLYLVDATGAFSLDALVCDLLGLLGCKVLTSGPEIESDPSFLDNSTALYKRGVDAWTLDVDSLGGSQTAFIPNVVEANANTQGSLVYTNAAGIFLRESDGTVTQLSTSTTDRRPALDAAMSKVVFDREAGGSAKREVFIASLVSTGKTVTASNPTPNLLRLSYFIECNGMKIPYETNLPPDQVQGQLATWLVSNATGCASPSVTFHATNGFLTDEVTQAEPLANTPPNAAFVAPASNGSIDQWKPISIRVIVRDNENGQLSDVVVRMDGQIVGTTTAFDLPVPPGGWPAGNHTFTVTGTDSGGLDSTPATLTLPTVMDTDGDGIPNTAEALSCFPAGSASDPDNAWLDHDNDGILNANDPAPCTSANNSTVKTTPSTLNVYSNGVPVGTTVTTNAVSLVASCSAKLATIGGITANIAAAGWTVKSNGREGTASFDRIAVNEFLLGNNPLGQVIANPTGMYVPMVVVVTCPGGVARGLDLSSPTVNNNQL